LSKHLCFWVKINAPCFPVLSPCFKNSAPYFPVLSPCSKTMKIWKIEKSAWKFNWSYKIAQNLQFSTKITINQSKSDKNAILDQNNNKSVKKWQKQVWGGRSAQVVNETNKSASIWVWIGIWTAVAAWSTWIWRCVWTGSTSITFATWSSLNVL